MRLKLTARTGQPDLLGLPWHVPLEAWHDERLVEVQRGISRHVVRFVHLDGAIYALKELPRRYAEREYQLLRHLADRQLPVVDVVGVVGDRQGDAGPLDAVLITRHLEFALPYRALFARGALRDLRGALLDALAGLLVRLHLAGFFWGDCSLSNTLFRRDAGTLAAYLVDAETGELHPALSDGQRRHDLDVARENIAGELLDVQAAFELAGELDPIALADGACERYEKLWDELTTEEVFGPDERFRVEQRLRRVNELGFDVDEVELVATDDGHRLRLNTHVVEPGHHRRRLLSLTGLDVQENQARRLLNDMASYRAHLEDESDQVLPPSVVAHRWLQEIFEPTVAAVPDELRGKRDLAELFHEILDHKYLRSQAAGRDIGFADAARSYVDEVLRHQPDEWGLALSGE